MPDNPLSSLYPQPPQASGNLLTGDPSKVIGVLNALNQNALQQQQIRANTGVENLYKGAVDANGQPNHALLMQRLPTLGVNAPAVASALLSQQGQGIQNTTNQFGLLASQNKFVLDGLGTLADMPHPTMDAVRNFVVSAARNTGVPSPIYNSWVNSLPKDEKGLKSALVTARNMAIGSANTYNPVQGSPDAAGASKAITQGQFGYETAGAGGDPNAPIVPNSVKTQSYRAPGIATGLPPGSGAYLESSAKAGTDLENTARTYPQDIADLSNLIQEGKVLANKTGPTFESEKKVNTILNRFGIPGTMSKEELAAGDSFDKIAKQITTNQAVMLGGGTDAGRAMILGATPNTGMSQYGIEGVGQMMLGNRDAINVARQEWIKAKKAQGLPQNGHLDWLDKFTAQGFDPRVFQFNRMSRENQQKFLNQMDPAEIGDFENHYNAAIENKWVKPLKGASGG